MWGLGTLAGLILTTADTHLQLANDKNFRNLIRYNSNGLD